MAHEWQIRETEQALRQFKRLGNQQKKQYRDAVIALTASDDPRNLGTFKRGKKYAAYYDLGRSFRLVYQVMGKEMIILLLDVGDHKEVYGKD